MKSNVCKIDNGTKDLEAIFKESEKVAVYNDLDQKQTLHLRLLCEEIDGMLPNIIDDFQGDLWFEFENGVCKVNVSFQLAEISTAKKEALVNIAKSKNNAAEAGVVGKIRSLIEDLFFDKENVRAMALSSGQFNLSTGLSGGADFSYLWSLEQYKNNAKTEQEEWDELEKSLLSSIADDVIVSVKGKTVDLVVVKKFA